MTFSALQRAENFSTQRAVARVRRHFGLSVLFSEPKISQRRDRGTRDPIPSPFSALQRAENFSTHSVGERDGQNPAFSALQRAENFSTSQRIEPAAFA